MATFQSLVRKDEVKDIVADYGHVVIDECHHVPSVSFERVLSEVRAKYITGLTATPKRRDGRHPISQMQLGPIRYTVDLKTQAATRPFEHTLIVRDTMFKLKEDDLSIQEIYKSLTLDTKRNELILNDVITALTEKRSPILLTERRDHLLNAHQK
ncbi:MAG: DEAD/DEAH box helicase family protein [Proteobacteria bacterium]|nr:DEAD/DEAH box helicase family protein [Pseudomonadota bacterium]